MLENEAEELKTRLGALLRSRLATIEPEIIDGKKSYLVRCRSGEMRCRLPMVFRGSAVKPEARATHIEACRSKVPAGGTAGALDEWIERAKTDKAEEKAAPIMISGTASSTSVDWYGTEMSLQALSGMAEQFRAGVDVAPRHGGWLSPLSWNEMMGRTIMANIERGDVAEPAEGSTDPGFTLAVTGECDPAMPLVADLVRRLDAKQPIGLSIGGWFREVRYLTNDEGDVDRIIIERVELDHVAVVRSPANPDCMDLEVMRSIAADVLRARAKAALPVPAGDPPVAVPADPPARSVAPPVISDPAGRGKVACDKDACSGDGCSEDGCGCACHGERSTGAPAVRSVVPPVVAAPPVVPEEGRTTETVTAPVVVDTGDAPRNSHPVEAESGRSTSEESPMDPAIKAMLDQILAGQTADRATTTSIATRLDAIEAARAAAPPAPVPVPAPAAESADVTELRAKLAAAESEKRSLELGMLALIDQPQRSGRSGAPLLSNNPAFTGSELDALIGRSKAERAGRKGADAICRTALVAERAKPVLAMRATPGVLLSSSPAGHALREAAQDAPELLRQLLVAAEEDGIIGNLETGWN